MERRKAQLDLENSVSNALDTLGNDSGSPNASISKNQDLKLGIIFPR